MGGGGGGGGGFSSIVHQTDASGAHVHGDDEAAEGGLVRPRSTGFFKKLFCCMCAPATGGDGAGGGGGGGGQGQKQQRVAVSHTGALLRAPIIGAQKPGDSGKPCLVLDLDETLVHSSFKPVPNPDYVIPVEIDNTVHHVYVYVFNEVFNVQ